MNLDALKDDAGGMLDAISELVDGFDSGQHPIDIVVTRDGKKMWLVDEVMRAYVDKHADAKVKA